ncbi:hypothetical protein D3C75_1348870 [compost metagenome]
MFQTVVVLEALQDVVTEIVSHDCFTALRLRDRAAIRLFWAAITGVLSRIDLCRAI